MQPKTKRIPNDLAFFLIGLVSGLIPVVCSITAGVIANQFNYMRSCQAGSGGCIVSPAISIATLVLLIALLPAIWFSIRKLRNRGIGKWTALAITSGGYVVAFVTYITITNNYNPDNYPFVAALFTSYVAIGLFYVVSGLCTLRLNHRNSYGKDRP